MISTKHDYTTIIDSQKNSVGFIQPVGLLEGSANLFPESYTLQSKTPKLIVID